MSRLVDLVTELARCTARAEIERTVMANDIGAAHEHAEALRIGAMVEEEMAWMENRIAERVRGAA